ncbi:phytoene desaturase family protein [Nocardia jinanensis]|uniref:Pyridine nucleotide-disulfide oxidoreductase domain-containing protein 2 n=1 Tax=Nocardia jinanensis TaxID=382504 RepID=A0A917VMW9_9NOCA|nr:NAD(P)/FAD-dependent oxidoreductase [Nocardia jinanensis]GGL01214.1 oxidoreductase [Nocardia jinanensis]
MVMRSRYDVVIVGGGHNGLVAAAYLARAGRSVLVLEQAAVVGGAAVSARVFDGVDVRLSRYSYLVSLLPDRILRDLGLRFDTRKRRISSYTPAGSSGLLIDNRSPAATRESFARVTGSYREFEAWQRFYEMTGEVARAVFPTFTEPLPTAAQLRQRVGERAWAELFARPLGETIEQYFADDLVRGAVFTDALIGTFTHAHDPSLLQNRCFLYHVIGGGTGDWDVPVGGMGALTDALAAAARAAGAELVTGTEATAVSTDGRTAEVAFAGAAAGTVAARYVLVNASPVEAARLLGEPAGGKPEGAQLKINMVLDRLPRLRDTGVAARDAFAGTFHIAESYDQLEHAYREAAAGRLPTIPPSEIYCHTLTDPGIAASAAVGGSARHTLTLFGLHTPARLFADNPEGAKEAAITATLTALDAVLAEPIRDCLARDVHGAPCLDAATPVDLQHSLRLPGGHIFHGDLSFPYLSGAADTPAQRWGVDTAHANVLRCGAGALRGGGVSGIGGHNAAMAVLEETADRRPGNAG